MNEISKKLLEDFETGHIGFTDMEVMRASVNVDPLAYSEEEADGVYAAYTLFESPTSLARRHESEQK